MDEITGMIAGDADFLFDNADIPSPNTHDGARVTEEIIKSSKRRINTYQSPPAEEGSLDQVNRDRYPQEHSAPIWDELDMEEGIESAESDPAPLMRVDLEWRDLDHTGQSVVLKELTDCYSFQKACAILALLRDDIETWLAIHQAQVDQQRLWEEDVAKWRVQGIEVPDDYQGDGPVGVALLTRSEMHKAALVVESLGLVDLAGHIRAKGHTTVAWPLDIDLSSYKIHRIHDGSFKTSGMKKWLDQTDHPGSDAGIEEEPDDSIRQAIIYSLALTYPQSATGHRVRLLTAILPQGTVVVGPHGSQILAHGGKYRVVYPGHDSPDEQAYFSFTLNDLPPQVMPEIEEEPETETYSRVVDVGDTYTESSFFEEAMADPSPAEPDIQIVPKVVATVRENPVFDNLSRAAAKMHQKEIPRPGDETGGPSPETNMEHYMGLLNASPLTEKGLAAQIQAAQSLCLPEQDPAEARQSKLDEEYEQRKITFEAFSPRELLKDVFNADPKTGTDPGHKQQTLAREVPEDHSVGPVELARTPAAVDDARDLAFLTIALPEGYSIRSPTGYMMNFETHHRGRNDGRAPVGTAGVYAFYLPEVGRDLPPGLRPCLHDWVGLRILLGEQMNVACNGYLLQRRTSEGMHQIVEIDGELDLVNETGRYRLFNGMQAIGVPIEIEGGVNPPTGVPLEKEETINPTIRWARRIIQPYREELDREEAQAIVDEAREAQERKKVEKKVSDRATKHRQHEHFKQLAAEAEAKRKAASEEENRRGQENLGRGNRVRRPSERYSGFGLTTNYGREIVELEDSSSSDDRYEESEPEPDEEQQEEYQPEEKKTMIVVLRVPSWKNKAAVPKEPAPKALKAPKTVPVIPAKRQAVAVPNAEPPVKRPRGRPRKHAVTTPANTNSTPKGPVLKANTPRPFDGASAPKAVPAGATLAPALPFLPPPPAPHGPISGMTMNRVGLTRAPGIPATAGPLTTPARAPTGPLMGHHAPGTSGVAVAGSASSRGLATGSPAGEESQSEPHTPSPARRTLAILKYPQLKSARKVKRTEASQTSPKGLITPE
ncbi:hypothetical protein JX266_001281 [Neoarthrinium moseri]|nr:hypothetical protein JX266_001281 [Neoarthrinium moseri]